jgi:hypothetical protein
MTDIQKVTIALARPRGNFEGRVETGHYTVNDGTVTLVEPNGVPVDKFKLSPEAEAGRGCARGCLCTDTPALLQAGQRRFQSQADLSEGWILVRLPPLPSGIGCVQPTDEDGLLIFTGRWLTSRPAKRSATPAAGTAALHRLSTGKQITFSDFTARICMWLPGNAHEEILDSYNGIA